MKKVLIVVMCLLLLVCLCACNKDQYKKMTKVVAADYGTIKVSAETVKGSDKLNSVVNIKNQDNKSTISYSVERFTKISADKIPTEYKTTYVGAVELVDGVQTSQTGDKLEGIEFAEVGQGHLKFNFDKSYFADAEFKDGVFTAKVLATRQFIGYSLMDCTDMTVRFDYEAEMKVLTVHYTDANDVSITITYEMQ